VSEPAIVITFLIVICIPPKASCKNTIPIINQTLKYSRDLKCDFVRKMTNACFHII
jgi:hypothetical protein